MTVNTPSEFLALELSHIQDAEQQAAQALQKIAQEADGKELRQMLDRRLEQGERILSDVQQALQRLDGNGRSSQNAAARGLIQETERMLREVKAPEMKQAVAIAGVQKLEHYCIAAWGTVKALAHEIGEEELARSMQQAVEEGYRLDREMTELAEGQVNPEALQQSNQQQSGQQSSGQQSTGQDDRARSEQGRGSSSGSGDSGSGRSSSDDLKAREYRGEDGQIHHHTKEYMERQGKSGTSAGSGREENRSQRKSGEDKDRGRGSGER